MACTPPPLASRPANDGRGPATTPRHNVSATTLARVNAWTPEGQQACSPCDKPTPDKILCIGICQSMPFLFEGWTQYMAMEKEDPELVAAFTQAFALTVRRCPSALEPMVRQLVEHATVKSLTADVCVRLSHLITDLGNKDVANILIAKTNAIPDLPRSFYMSMLRLATEALTPVDMDLALDVTEQMNRKGYGHCTISLRLVLTGMSRLPTPSIEAAIRVFKFKMGGTEATAMADACLMHAFFNLLDNVIGQEAVLASEYVQSLNPKSVLNCITSACPYVPCLTRKGCFNDCDPNTTYYIADPLSVDFGGVPDVPEGAYVVFLYSSLRQLDIRSQNLCSSSPFHKKLADVKRFLATAENSCVVPFASEIAIRGMGDKALERPSSHSDRFMLFITLMHLNCPSHKCAVLSNDAAIIKEATDKGFSVRTVICAAQPSSSAPQSSSGSTPLGRQSPTPQPSPGVGGMVAPAIGALPDAHKEQPCASANAPRLAFRHHYRHRR